jgi:hypothetical protein
MDRLSWRLDRVTSRLVRLAVSEVRADAIRSRLS